MDIQDQYNFYLLTKNIIELCNKWVWGFLHERDIGKASFLGVMYMSIRHVIIKDIIELYCNISLTVDFDPFESGN